MTRVTAAFEEALDLQAEGGCGGNICVVAHVCVWVKVLFVAGSLGFVERYFRIWGSNPDPVVIRHS